MTVKLISAEEARKLPGYKLSDFPKDLESINKRINTESKSGATRAVFRKFEYGVFNLHDMRQINEEFIELGYSIKYDDYGNVILTW